MQDVPGKRLGSETDDISRQKNAVRIRMIMIGTKNAYKVREKKI